MNVKIVTILGLIISQIAISQKLEPKEIAEFQNKIMIDRLDLTPGQEQEIKAHNAKYSQKQAALMNREGSMFGKIGEMKKLKKARNAELEKILSAQQFQIFEDEIEPEIRSHMRSKMKS